MVGLPHRPNGMFNRVARTFATLGPAGDQVPKTSPEVGASEDCVRDHGYQQDSSYRSTHPTVSPAPAETSSASALGPYGVS
jgi:hypothetical protein